MQRTLLVLAAGMGSRYGGLKQIDPIGPGGETIIDYSIYDAIRAGFTKLVFVIRRDLENQFRETVGRRFESRLPVEYVFQELDCLPPGFSAPPARKKPWGTGHAILMAEPAIHEPFAVINGDDFYGARSFRILADFLASGQGSYAMVGFILRNTLSEFGGVARGVCRLNADSFLEGVTEILRIEKEGDGARGVDPAGQPLRLTCSEIVSLNMWGFTPGLFSHLREQFAEFLLHHGQDEKAEFYIPTVVNTLVGAGLERLKVLQTPDSWFGVTYREDRPRVLGSIRALIARGDYPEKLWS